MTDVARIHQALVELGVARLLAALALKGRRANGQRWRIVCPVHKGSNTNCVVEPKDGAIVFVCHSGCGGAGGDALALIAAVRGLDVRAHFGEVLREAASIAGVAIAGARADERREPAPIDPAVEARARELAVGRDRVLSALLEMCPLEGEGLRYLTEERALGADVCTRARVGFVSNPARVRRVLQRSFPIDVLDELGIVYRGEHFAFERHRLLVPIVRGGRPIYVQGRTLDPTTKKHERWRSMRGAVPALWNHDAIDQAHRPILIAEGAIDGMTALQWSAERFGVVAIFGAGGLKDEWCREMRGREVLLALDPDDAGDRGASKATKMLTAYGAEVRRLAIPAGLDLNDWYRAEVAA